MKALKAYFLSRGSREKPLVASFIFLGAAVWLFVFVQQATAFGKQYSKDRTRLAVQDAVIARSAAVDARSEAAVATLEPVKTLNSGALLAAVSEMATAAGFQNRPNIVTEPPVTSELFTLNSVRVTQAGVTDWVQIANFYLALNKRAPYMNLKDIVITQVTSGGGADGGGGRGAGRGGPPGAQAAQAVPVTTYTLIATVQAVERAQR